MSRRELYLWTDLETTGSDVATNKIIEVGCVLTDHNLAEIERRSWVVNDGDALDLMKVADPVVIEMHTVNELIDDLKYGVSTREVECEIINWIGIFGKPHDFILSGSGVGHFDRKFIDKYMSGFSKWLKYYPMDVGVLRRGLTLMGRTDLLMPKSQSDAKNHRALDDALLHLEEMRHIKIALSQ